MEQWTVILEPADEGGFTSYIAEVPGAISEGQTEDEAIAMALDALHELMASYREDAIKKAPSNAIVRRLDHVA
jgi:predicted RNase H-like HicB family nuclease